MIRMIAIGLCLVLAASGCSSERKLGQVSGTVTYRGKPLTSGIIQFQSDSGPMAAGGIDANGHFVLSTKINGDGAWAGSHRVSVIPFVPAASDLPPGKPYPDPAEIPKKYREMATTPLTAEVVGGQANEFTFDLMD